MMFVWEAQSVDSGKVYHIGVFDLNRWYHAQMPRSIRWEKTATSKVCSFVSFHSLSTAVEEAQCPLIVSNVWYCRSSSFFNLFVNCASIFSLQFLFCYSTSGKLVFCVCSRMLPLLGYHDFIPLHQLVSPICGHHQFHLVSEYYRLLHYWCK